MSTVPAAKLPLDDHRLPGFILTTFNDMHDLPEFVQTYQYSIGRCPEDRMHSIIVVDGGSTDDTVAFMKAKGFTVIGPHSDDFVMHGESKPGSAWPWKDLAFALNAGIRWLVGDFVDDEEGGHFTEEMYHSVHWIHPDMRFGEQWNWWVHLMDYLDANPDVGKVGPNSFNLEGTPPDRPGNTCPWAIPYQVLLDLARSVVRKQGTFPGNADYVQEGLFFDEGYNRCWGAEDWDLNQRIINLGKKVMITQAAKVWHKGMGSRSKYTDTKGEAMYNRELFAKKWGEFKPPV